MADDKDKKSGLAWVTIVIAACAAVFSFFTTYGPFALGIAVVGAGCLGLYELYKNESLLTWLSRDHPRILGGMFLLAIFVGIWFIVLGLRHIYNVADLFRPDIGTQPISKHAYLAAAAPWYVAPPPGTAADVRTDFDLAGWKRLAASGVLNDPVNKDRQMLYVETTPFAKSYKEFTAELELPQTVEVTELYAFLTRDASDRSTHEQLDVMRTTYPLGVDRNQAQIMVSSPDAGEKLVAFIVVAPKNKKPLPPDIESSISLIRLSAVLSRT